MYSNRMTPVQRMRNGDYSSHHTKSATVSTNNYPAKKTFEQSNPFPIRMNGDYQVLRKNVQKERSVVQKARVSLASSLEQLGEHHLRQREYDDAMDAFTEALREKKSVFWNIGDSLNKSNSSNIVPGLDTQVCDQEHDNAIDEIVNTLRNIGNVHSLRGEQEEAMRYFAEVTNLRAQKKNHVAADSLSGVGTTETRSFLSGMNDDTSTLMSEFNEDVKALDDLFRSITFRSQPVQTAKALYSNEKRKSKQSLLVHSHETAKDESQKYKRRKSNSSADATCSGKEQRLQENTSNIVENEPFTRSTSNFCLTAPGNETSEALAIYKSIIEDSYRGGREKQHHELINSLSLRAELLNEGRRQVQVNSDKSKRDFSKAADLELTLEVYKHILEAHEESSLSIHEEKCSLASDASNSSLTDEETSVAAMIASTMICMGSVYYKLGNRVKELQMYQDAKTVYIKTFGDNHVCVAGTRKNIGMVLAERGEYDAAMKQFEKAKQVYMCINQSSEMNRDVASAISCMGNVKNRTGELDEALSKYMEALHIYKSLHAKQESQASDSNSSFDIEAGMLRDVTSTLKVIGMVHAKKGDLDTAMLFFQEAMSLLRAPEIANTLSGRETMAAVLTRIASIHLKKSDLDQAMSDYREAYDLIALNSDGITPHPDAAGILHYIGGIYHKKTEYDEAMACYQEAIRIYHSTLGPGNPTVAGTLVMVGSIYYKRRNLDSAMMFYREALRLNRDAYGMHHPDVAPILKSIGTILTKKGEYQEAYGIFRDVLRIKCAVHGTDHPEVASAYKSLGNVHYKMGDLADAERQYRHALSIYRRTRGEDHADTVAAKTTIEHLRYWMREREQRQIDQRNSKNSSRHRSSSVNDERSC